MKKRILSIMLIVITFQVVTAQTPNLHTYPDTITIPRNHADKMPSNVILKASGITSNIITAKLHDKMKFVITSAPSDRYLVSNIPPTVSIITPVNNQITRGPVNLQL
ncbi:MAG: hypothetical protein ABIN97_21325, partial [Ginsengibacter sp.]